MELAVEGGGSISDDVCRCYVLPQVDISVQSVGEARQDNGGGRGVIGFRKRRKHGYVNHA